MSLCFYDPILRIKTTFLRTNPLRTEFLFKNWTVYTAFTLLFQIAGGSNYENIDIGCHEHVIELRYMRYLTIKGIIIWLNINKLNCDLKATHVHTGLKFFLIQVTKDK